MNQLLPLSGALASVWIVIGVIWAGSMYPDYSHSRQFCSELGAVGAPTQKISPLINNYPLGILFILFGGSVLSEKLGEVQLMVAGLAIVFHGLGTWLAGYFPMDSDPYTKHPSVSGKIHALAGLIMFISLFVAPISALFSANYGLNFRLFSLLCAVGSIVPLLHLGKSERARELPGLYQRLSYGVQLIWLFCFSLLIAWKFHHASG